MIPVTYNLRSLGQRKATALTFAGVMGLVGGFFPSLKAAHVAPAEAMRD